MEAPKAMCTLVAATRNRKKLAELSRMLKQVGITLMGLDDFPGCPDVEEDAPDFRGNALKKARAIAAHTGHAALADDSGLVVDALGGRPGVLSARYSGPEATDKTNNALLLEELASVPDEKRTARFVCVIALVEPGQPERIFEGEVEGRIAFSLMGESGFGYDPLFIPDGHERSFAQMSGTEKDSMSHRGRALRAFIEWLGSSA